MHKLEPMPNAADIEFKEKFIEHYSKLTDFEIFKKYCLSFLRRSIRVNTLKITIPKLVKRIETDWNLMQIPWCKQGFWVDHKGIGEEKRRDIGNLTEHALGYFYVQEAASMIPPVVLDPNPGEIVLDMCASPGSKASQIAQYMQNKGLIVANDYKGIRLAPLGINLQRMGITNCIITLMEGRRFKGHQFDKILLDAPCSGTGTIRKSIKTLRMWNPLTIGKIAGQQKQLINAAFENLRPGGTMVYSTCSLEPIEDENVVTHLLDTNSDARLEDFELPLKRGFVCDEFNGMSFHRDIQKCLKLWPQDNDTEGFFVAKIRKSI
ncbi:MAG: RsmB/NOP family class I SAM-dependent RNA methyltransferase [Nanoarchaeota archaeon]|nr:RsmB/NOP family class I SAM-dependent RNA methyltransferase [Nanoarchaeota archaeon]